jgi:hypothetical protein
MHKVLQSPVVLGGLMIAISGLIGCGGTSAAPINGASTLSQVSVVVTPQNMSVSTGTVQAFTATVNNSNVSGVQWEVNGFVGGGGNVGTIDTSGNYTAPQFIPNPATVTITAVSNADNTKSGSTPVTIIGAQVPAQITMSPKSAALQIGTSLDLSATVTGPADTGVIWQVLDNGTGVVNGNTTVGTIVPGNGTAVYTAPAQVPSGGSATIRAVSHAQPNVYAQCVVTITTTPPNVATVTISPTSATVEAGTFFIFTGDVVGVTNTAILWQVNGVTGGTEGTGTIVAVPNTNTAIYNAPAKEPTPNIVTVTAVSAAQPNKFDSASVTITAPPVNPVTISVTGETSLTICSTAKYQANVGNTTNEAVTWQVNGVNGGNATFGTITPDPALANFGDYVAPTTLPSQPTVVIGAVPAAAPNESGTLDVTLTNPTVTVNVIDTQNNSSTVQVGVGQTAPFQGTVTTACGVATATWYVGQNGTYVEGGNATFGTVVPDVKANVVTYTAPAAVPSNPVVTVKATADVNPSDSGLATVTINAAPVITVAITPSTQQTVVILGAPGTSTINYQATVSGTTNTDLTWEVNGIPGGDNTCSCGVGTISANLGDPTQATYTAPAAVPSPATVNVTAVSVPFPNSASNSDPVLITNPPPPPPTITIEPGTIFPIIPGQTLMPTASVTCQAGNCNQVVDWSLSLSSGTCTVATCGSLNPVQTNGEPTTYTSPISIPTDPYFVNLTATVDSDQSVFTTVPIEITNSAIASVSITPTNPTIQAGTGGIITFTATVINAPAGTNVSWNLQCNSLAPQPGEWCFDFSTDGGGPGCLDVTSKECFTDTQSASPSTPAQYTPPAELGTNFQVNGCTTTAGTNGIVPMIASISSGNCQGDSCTATACITVTPP